MVLVARTSLSIALLSLLARTARPLLATTTALSIPTPTQCPIPALSRPFSAAAMSSSTGPAQPSPASPEFLQEKLATILASPHIHFNQPPAGGPLHIRMGHGPVDLFSTRFLNSFASDARGVVAGKEVDLEGLQSALLALQKRWNPQEARFEAQSGAEKPTTKVLWARKDGGQQAAVTASAEVKEEGGTHRISHLTLDGDESLFSA